MVWFDCLCIVVPLGDFLLYAYQRIRFKRWKRERDAFVMEVDQAMSNEVALSGRKH